MITKLTKQIVVALVAMLFMHTANAQQITYSKDKADLHEYLKITKVGKTKINYEIYMVSGGCSEFKNSGVATLKTTNLGGESDIDEDDNAFDVALYEGKSKGIAVTIKLGVQKGYTNRARFSWYNTKSEEDPCKTSSESLIKSK
jgi:hypothetical protein